MCTVYTLHLAERYCTAMRIINVNELISGGNGTNSCVRVSVYLHVYRWCSAYLYAVGQIGNALQTE